MFGSSKFTFDGLKRKLGEDAYKLIAEKENLPKTDEVIEKLGEKVYQKLYYPESESEFKELINQNDIDMGIFLFEKEDQLFTPNEILHLNKTQHNQIYKLNEFNRDRSCPFFSYAGNDKGPSMLPIDKIPQELSLLTEQTKQMIENAETPGERIGASIFQALRVFATHPAADGNKRLFKAIVHHGIYSNVDEVTHFLPGEYPELSYEKVRMAVFGNNLEPLAEELSEVYGIDIDLGKYKTAPYRIMHTGERRTMSLEKELEDSRIKRESSKTLFLRQTELDLIQPSKIKRYTSAEVGKAWKGIQRPQAIEDFVESISVLYKHQCLTENELHEFCDKALSQDNGFKSVITEKILPSIKKGTKENFALLKIPPPENVLMEELQNQKLLDAIQKFSSDNLIELLENGQPDDLGHELDFETEVNNSLIKDIEESNDQGMSL